MRHTDTNYDLCTRWTGLGAPSANGDFLCTLHRWCAMLCCIWNSHMRVAFELQRLSGCHSQQARPKADRRQCACFDLFVNLLSTDVPVPSEFTDGDICFGMGFQVFQD